MCIGEGWGSVYRGGVGQCVQGRGGAVCTGEGWGSVYRGGVGQCNLRGRGVIVTDNKVGIGSKGKGYDRPNRCSVGDDGRAVIGG